MLKLMLRQNYSLQLHDGTSQILEKVYVLSGTASQTALSFKPKDRFEEEMTFPLQLSHSKGKDKSRHAATVTAAALRDVIRFYPSAVVGQTVFYPIRAITTRNRNIIFIMCNIIILIY